MSSEREPSQWSLMILAALQDKPMYGLTVPKAVIAKRRAAGKRARRARAIQRGDAR